MCTHMDIGCDLGRLQNPTEWFSMEVDGCCFQSSEEDIPREDNLER